MNVVGIVPATNVSTINAVFAAYGHGPDSFSRPVQAVNGSGVTHWLVNVANMTETQYVSLSEMMAGNLPPLPDGSTWGVDGLPTESEAIAACAALDVDLESDAYEALAKRNLEFVPGPEE